MVNKSATHPENDEPIVVYSMYMELYNVKLCNWMGHLVYEICM